MTIRDIAEIKPGLTLGRYELLLPLARGGMAAVWAARARGARGFQKVVAIKTMLPSLSEDPHFESMFLDEAQIASQIRHPNVVQILDLGEEGDLLYIVMDWIDGEPLNALLRKCAEQRRRIPMDVAAYIVSNVCKGLHAAHELKNDDGELINLVHRDVSPQNILLTYDGGAKLVDFGVAKAVGISMAETGAGQLKGKVPYMSPEQILGKPVDRRADVFSAGVVLYQTVTTKSPFRGENDVATLHNVLYRELVLPSQILSDCPRGLDEVVTRTLAREPRERFQTALEMSTALEAVLKNVDEGPPSQRLALLVEKLLGSTGEERRKAIKQAQRQADQRPPGAAFAPPIVVEPVLPTPASGLFVPEDGPSIPEEQSLGTTAQFGAATRRAPKKRRRWWKVALLSTVAGCASVLAVEMLYPTITAYVSPRSASTMTPSASTSEAPKPPDPSADSSAPAAPSISASASSEPAVSASATEPPEIPPSAPTRYRPYRPPKPPEPKDDLPPLTDPGF